MGLALRAERRISVRSRVSGLPGRLVTAESGEVIFCFPLDVSEHGLGIITSKFLVPGENVILIVEGRPINLEVMWRIPDDSCPDDSECLLDLDGLYRYGLVCESPERNLEAIFEARGLIE